MDPMELIMHVIKAVYEKIPVKKYMTLLPVDSTVNPGSDVVIAKRLKKYGKAKIMADKATGIPLYDEHKESYSVPIRDIQLAYFYTDKEIEKAQREGSRLPSSKAISVRDNIHTQEDELAWKGNKLFGINGFLAHPDVPKISSRSRKKWTDPTITPDEILQDFCDVAWASNVMSGERVKSDTVVMSTIYHAIMCQQGLKKDSDKTLLDLALARCPHIKTVDTVTYCKDAGSNGKSVIQAYTKDKDLLHIEQVLPFKQAAPQAKDFSYVVPCRSEFGGVMIHDLNSVACMEK